MELFGWLLIGSLAVFLISTITIGLIIMYRLRHKNNVHATIFLKAGGLKKFLFDRKRLTERDVSGCVYMLDERAVYKTPWYDYIYFMEDNPKPIIFNHKESKPEIAGSELKTILDDDLIKKLFNQGELKTMQLLIILCLVSGIITMLLGVYIIASGVRVKITPELYQMIQNATKSVITGGYI